jgi:hypothetical protein
VNAPLPRSASTVFGIVVNGRHANIGLPSFAEAEQAAEGFADIGRRVEIIDRITGRVIKRLG